MTSDISIADREQYRDGMNRSVGAGVLGLFGATVVTLFGPERVATPALFAGVGLYYLGIIGYLVIWQRTGVRLFDEREEQIEHRTGQIVLLLLWLS